MILLPSKNISQPTVRIDSTYNPFDFPNKNKSLETTNKRKEKQQTLSKEFDTNHQLIKNKSDWKSFYSYNKKMKESY